MKIQFTKPYEITKEIVDGIWEVELIKETLNQKQYALLRCSSTSHTKFKFTMGPEYLRKWLREGIVTIIP